ncbi:hypothetical protein SAMN04488028_1165 [Reichenbachiella agariperforans]|uniref:DUF3828 domain-containing protein n=1 Tax=Reichenbachiella agariperforans TaxID=156994 RepID=A0A1M6WXJ1_REIAG|nr:hypothetical protein [Reichenbachiella agariperforans]SHK98299.1 hypothetical protein SAMN04488028_1165 [Reichenbachiella agariperforans]
MKDIITITVLAMYSLSCNSQNNSSNDSSAVEVVNGFYSWYIEEAYPKSTSYYQVPSYKKLSGASYIFDLDELRQRLSTIDFFSQEYRNKLIEQLNVCNDEMLKIKWEYEPEPMFNIKECNYLWGNQWVGGQGEKISGYKIKDIETVEDTIKCTVQILIDDNVSVKSIVSTKKIDGEYKIININLDWSR